MKTIHTNYVCNRCKTPFTVWDNLEKTKDFVPFCFSCKKDILEYFQNHLVFKEGLVIHIKQNKYKLKNRKLIQDKEKNNKEIYPNLFNNIYYSIDSDDFTYIELLNLMKENKIEVSCYL